MYQKYHFIKFYYTPEGWRDAILLKKGGQLLPKGEYGEAPTIQIEDIRYETKVLTTYNLEVANAHTFFVGEDGVLVHNSRTRRNLPPDLPIRDGTRKAHGKLPRPKYLVQYPCE